MATWGAKRKRSSRGGGTRKKGKWGGPPMSVRRSALSSRARGSTLIVNRTIAGFTTSGGTRLSGIIAPLTPTTYGYANLQWQLSDLPGYTDFVTLFEEYKVNSLTYRFRPKFNGADQGFGSTQGGVPDIMTAVDTDGGFSSTTLDALLQYSNVKFQPATREFVVKFKPAAFAAVQVDATTTKNTNKLSGTWMSLLSGASGGSVDYYGLAVGVQTPTGTNTTSPWTWDVYVTANVTFRRTF